MSLVTCVRCLHVVHLSFIVCASIRKNDPVALALSGARNPRQDCVCRFVFFDFAIISVSRFSLAFAFKVGALVFSVFQCATLFLTTTTPENIALAFRWFLTPLAWVGVPVQRLTFSLLFSLRFMSLVCSIQAHLELLRIADVSHIRLLFLPYFC
jgi:hypothetical protein